jgi:hypothetical protein
MVGWMDKLEKNREMKVQMFLIWYGCIFEFHALFFVMEKINLNRVEFFYYFQIVKKYNFNLSNDEFHLVLQQVLKLKYSCTNHQYIEYRDEDLFVKVFFYIFLVERCPL